MLHILNEIRKVQTKLVQILTSAAACMYGSASHSHTRWQHITSSSCMQWTPFRNYDASSKIWPCQLPDIYMNNIPVKVHPDLIWNNGALGFHEEVTPTRTTTTRRWSQFL